jgi:hypothetical protein
MAAGEDREFCERWQRSGRPLRYAEDVVVYHAHRLDLRGFVRQHFTYGRGADFLHVSRARRDGVIRHPKLEPPRFYVNLVLFPFRRPLRWKALPLASLLFLSQVAYGAGYCVQRLKRAFRTGRSPKAAETDAPEDHGRLPVADPSRRQN